MKCPKCGGKFKVLDSAPFNGAIYRKRICLECSHIVWTTERVESNSMIGYLDAVSAENKRRYDMKNRKV